MLIDAAVAWVKANCIDPKLRSYFARQLKDAVQRRIDCWFALGPVLTRQRLPHLIHVFAGELFIFELTHEQAAVILPGPNAQSTHLDAKPPGSNWRATPLVIRISDFELDPAVLTEGTPIAGSCSYEMAGDYPAGYCLRLDYQLGQGRDFMSWHYPDQILMQRGRFHFAFNHPADLIWDQVRGHRGPLALFLRVYTLPPSGDLAGRKPISNTCGALVQAV